MFTDYMQTKVIVNLDKLGISKPVTGKHYFELNEETSYLKVTKVYIVNKQWPTFGVKICSDICLRAFSVHGSEVLASRNR